MTNITIRELRNHLSKMRSEGAQDNEIAMAWRQAAETLPDPSAESNLAHHQINAMAHELGIGRMTGQRWRHPTTLGRHLPDPSARETLAIQWAEEYYKGCAMVCHVDGRPGAWWFRAYSVLPDFEETPKIEGQGFATLSEAYDAAMSSQIQMIDGR